MQPPRYLLAAPLPYCHTCPYSFALHAHPAIIGARRLQVVPRASLEFNRTSLPDHCRYKYLLNLAGNAASSRLKYLFFCNSTVVSPLRSGGNDGAGPGNEYEEFWYHRLKANENVLLPPDVTFLPGLIRELQLDDIRARRIAAAGTEWARRELTKSGVWCYWAGLLSKLAALQRKGGALDHSDAGDSLRESLKAGGPQPSRIMPCCVCDEDNGNGRLLTATDPAEQAPSPAFSFVASDTVGPGESAASSRSAATAAYQAEKDATKRAAHDHRAKFTTAATDANKHRTNDNNNLHHGYKKLVGSCQAKYPELLSRVKRELKPWEKRGISREMTEAIWRCGSKDARDARRLFGVYISIRDGSVAAERGGAGNWRAGAMADFIRSVAEEYNLPDCDFVMITADHASQAFHRPYNGSFNARLAPLVVPYRLQRDDGTVAAPGKTMLPQRLHFSLVADGHISVFLLTVHSTFLRLDLFPQRLSTSKPPTYRRSCKLASCSCGEVSLGRAD